MALSPGYPVAKPTGITRPPSFLRGMSSASPPTFQSNFPLTTPAATNTANDFGSKLSAINLMNIPATKIDVKKSEDNDSIYANVEDGDEEVHSEDRDDVLMNEEMEERKDDDEEEEDDFVPTLPIGKIEKAFSNSWYKSSGDSVLKPGSTRDEDWVEWEKHIGNGMVSSYIEANIDLFDEDPPPPIQKEGEKDRPVAPLKSVLSNRSVKSHKKSKKVVRFGQVLVRTFAYEAPEEPEAAPVAKAVVAVVEGKIDAKPAGNKAGGKLTKKSSGSKG